MSTNVFVGIRVRPPRGVESAKDTLVDVLDKESLLFDSDHNSKENNPQFFPKKPQRRDLTSRRKKNLTFGFDRVFGPDSQNVDVFAEAVCPLIPKVLNGINCSVFAYGATGAGKTHTMLGRPQEPGVMTLTVKQLFIDIEKLKLEALGGIEVDVGLSYLEVYNEQIRDLLIANSSVLAIQEDQEGSVLVPKLSIHHPKSADDIFNLLEQGNLRRTQHPTDANAESSRSHAVLQIFLKIHNLAAAGGASAARSNVVMSKLALIDLAGSERASATANRGARFKEGANINRSLLALGNCINALASAKPTTSTGNNNNNKPQHVPYRDSKLTRILKDALGGNCFTVMLACCSPSVLTLDDTHNTLQYANRAKNIRVKAVRNIVSLDAKFSDYQQTIRQQQQQIRILRDENDRLKRRLPQSDDALCAESAPDSTSTTVPPKSTLLNADQIGHLVAHFQEQASSKVSAKRGAVERWVQSNQASNRCNAKFEAKDTHVRFLQHCRDILEKRAVNTRHVAFEDLLPAVSSSTSGNDVESNDHDESNLDVRKRKNADSCYDLETRLRVEERCLEQTKMRKIDANERAAVAQRSMSVNDVSDLTMAPPALLSSADNGEDDGTGETDAQTEATDAISSMTRRLILAEVDAVFQTARRRCLQQELEMSRKHSRDLAAIIDRFIDYLCDRHVDFVVAHNSNSNDESNHNSVSTPGGHISGIQEMSLSCSGLNLSTPGSTGRKRTASDALLDADQRCTPKQFSDTTQQLRPIDVLVTLLKLIDATDTGSIESSTEQMLSDSGNVEEESSHVGGVARSKKRAVHFDVSSSIGKPVSSRGGAKPPTGLGPGRTHMDSHTSPKRTGEGALALSGFAARRRIQLSPPLSRQQAQRGLGPPRPVAKSAREGGTRLRRQEQSMPSLMDAKSRRPLSASATENGVVSTVRKATNRIFNLRSKPKWK